MADEKVVLNAEVRVDASSAKTAQSTVNSSIEAMVAEYRKANQQMQSDINKLKQDEQTLAAQRKQQAEEFKRQQDGMAQSSRTFTQQYRSSMRDIALAAGALVGSYMLAKKAFDEFEKAAQFRGAINATRNLANAYNIDMQSIMDALDEASKHTLTAAEKFKLINEVLVKGGPDVEENLQKLVENTRALAIAAGDDAAAFKQAEAAGSEFIAVMMQLPTVTGLVNGLTTALTAASQAAILLAAESAATKALEEAKRQHKPQEEWEKIKQEARDRELKRLLPAVGIVPGGEPEDDMRSAARRQRLEADNLAKELEKTQQATAERLAKGRDRSNELIIAAGQKMRDAESTMYRDIEKLAADHANKMAEIALEGARKREDIALETSRKIEDAETDYLRDISENQRDTANKRIEIEQRYQDQLRQIQRRFEDEYWGAVKSRDAVGLVEAVRNRNRGIQDAGRQRDIDNANADRDEAEKEQRAAIAYQRKLQEAQRYYQRAMQDQRIDEQRRAIDENLKNRANEQEIRNHYAQRLIDIRNGLQAELNEANAKYGQSEADYSAHLARMAAIASSYMGMLGEPTGYGSYAGGGTRRRQEGGVDLVSTPTPFLAGESGPELVLTVPLGASRALPAPASMSHTVSGDVSHQLNMITTQGLRGMEGRIVAAVMQAMRQVVRP